MQIAIDAMGGDFGPRATIGGVLLALQRHPQLQVTVLGPRQELSGLLETLAPGARVSGALTSDTSRTGTSRSGTPRPGEESGSAEWQSRVTLVDAPRVVRQSTPPMEALENPAGTSLLAMLECVKSGQAQAGVSCGNTGALMALARHQVGTVAGISRPAISTAVPTRQGGRCYLLDLGASVDVHARHLVDFADMGSLMAQAVDGAASPKVALLNVGVEAGKGVARVREADAILRARKDSRFHYIGYLEGDGIFSGDADVVVCDGFVGNAVLKASEGVSQMLLKRVQETFESNWKTRLVSALARPALMRLKAQLDPVRYNGASLLGLERIIVKSHGNAGDRAFAFAIERAMREVEVDLPAFLRQAWAPLAAAPSISSVDSDDRVDSGFRNTRKSDDSSLQG